jgi:hypothetical protein
MPKTHTFEILAGELSYSGDISTGENGVMSYSEDQPEELPEALDQDFKRMLELINNFIKTYGSLEKLEINGI